MSDGDGPMNDPLSTKERLEWDVVEADFWDRFNSSHVEAEAKAEREWQEVQTAIRVDMAALSGRRSLLSETKLRLARELMATEQEFAEVVNAGSEKADKLHKLECEHRQKQLQRQRYQEQVAQDMVQWFQQGRQGGKGAFSTELPPIRDKSPLTMQRPEAERAVAGFGGTPDGRRRPLPGAPPPQAPLPIPRQPHPGRVIVPDTEALVDIVDFEGDVIGCVRRVEPWNQWVQAILQLPIKRPVKIRYGRKFNNEQLTNIYERVDAKGVKWVACMIQATGNIQERRCQTCEKNQGAFADCIVVGGSQFAKCGNCEWNRQGCHAGNSLDIAMPIREYVRNEEPPVMRASRLESSPSLARRVLAAQEALARSSGQSGTNYLAEAPSPGSRAYYANETAHAAGQSSRRQSLLSTGFTPANAPSGTTQSPRQTFPSASTSGQGSPLLVDDSLEITPADLVLRHNGQVYTYPPCMEGVPVEKIDPNHPYWDPKWDEPVGVIEPKLRMWQEKLAEVNAARERGEKTGSARYQNGRQVARGHTMMQFLQHGEINPYQLLSKRYMTGTRGSITSYDTLYRLCETLEELAKYQVPVKPLDWVRQRLHELIESQGPSFNLAKTMHDFYNDRKLTAARHKAGYRNIGRPAGIKMPPRAGKGDQTPDSRKRKSPGPGRESVSRQSPAADSTLMDGPMAAPGSRGREKRQKSISYPPERSLVDRAGNEMDEEAGDDEQEDAQEDELNEDSWSDADSWSGAELSPDDFRVYQVRSRLYTSSEKVTQYLAYVDEKEMFEHQVLKDTDPIAWGVHRQPIDFHFDLDDLFQVVWNKDSLRVYLVLSDDQVAAKDGKPRGSMMVAFKRERTKRRFLLFCRHKEVDLVVYPA